MTGFLFLVALTASAPGLPADPVIMKLDDQQFQFVTDDEGNTHLVDLWVKASDLRESDSYQPDADNTYHLYTKSNPTRSQLLAFGNASTVTNSYFNGNKRTVVIIHGWTNSVISPLNTVLVPAFLSAADINVIVVDWNAGSGTINYPAAVFNTATSGESVARFLVWLNSVTGASLSSCHIVGHSLGGHQAGIVGRNLGGQVPYITSLDPALPGWVFNSNRFKSSDGIYTEVIHTNVARSGQIFPLGDVDFYPNGGYSMPGCDGQISCNHNRAFYYFGESVSRGGFTGRRCDTFMKAKAGDCDPTGTLQMGGLHPKIGHSGVYYLTTNAAAPFSQG